MVAISWRLIRSSSRLTVNGSVGLGPVAAAAGAVEGAVVELGVDAAGAGACGRTTAT